ncbi:MAG: iron-sulfur cluster assembly protein IscA [Pseudomonadota bacterium]|nr:iron-sulfur cluster assembly protein IscA [Pseudomonadota bacterium]
MSVTLTERAAARMQRSLAGRGKGLGIRLGVKTSGCSGMSYVMEFVDEVEAGDACFESQGMTVVIDARSMPYLMGTTLDFVREGLNEGFKFENPNVKSACGCGESFSVSA